MEEEKKEKSKKDPDWENRRLCVDGACIGVIGPDGYCKECGKPEDPEMPEARIREAEDADVDSFPESPSAPESESQENGSTLDAYWKNRRLCADEACIGVIGPDGYCKECGKPETPSTG
ncbi:MAG: hypothetical protein JRI76_02610 [Deltaproteobacteria bacterium]|nr:hypothetical protein [Deltaproteobacteria bacterium]MBW2040902.1 hypothetical protein [Deltaproteobacteria bacterium]MBW2131002.1 hypothetical protein [Deltaproteobacteria bacterium]